jgi:hypothetical protein
LTFLAAHLVFEIPGGARLVFGFCGKHLVFEISAFDNPGKCGKL